MNNSENIEKVVYDLCVQANTELPQDVYEKILNAFNNETNEDAKNILSLILQNADMASVKKMPLCQDTGQVLVFVKGKCFPEGFRESINKGVQKAYEENYFRKSVVKNALFDRTNTKTNTPCIIYTEVSDNEELEIELLLKGGGSENVCDIKMLSPTASEDEIINYIVSVVKNAGSKACPPYFIGVGIGGTIEYAGLLSKKALCLEKNIDENHKNLAEKIQNAVNKLQIGPAGLGGNHTALDVKVLTDFTHIACMPVAVTINCHSSRHAKGRFVNNKWEIKKAKTRGQNVKGEENSSLLTAQGSHVNTSEIEKIRTLKQGDNILLSGEIYTARDMAHKRLLEMMDRGEKLPFDLKDKIIFYAGPCPCASDCVTGSIGPTTAARMDKYAPIFYKNGILATIGKGDRSEEVKNAIKETNGVYFAAVGGVACYLAEKFISKELIAFEDLGTEAIYKFEVKDLPLRVGFS